MESGAEGKTAYSMLIEKDSQTPTRVATGNCVITFYAMGKLIGLIVTSLDIYIITP